MTVRTAIWKVGASPALLSESKLAKELVLEDMIVAAPQLISDEWMLIGRQEATGYGGIIDLLGMSLDGSLVLIELKRDRTPREVVAQALDYASWVAGLASDQIAAIYDRFKPGCNLTSDFLEYFGQELLEDGINQSHEIVIVAGSLDDSTERIVGYLNDRGISINVLCFQVFAHGSDQLLSRTWLLDPQQVQASAAVAKASGTGEPWNGEFYCNFGHGENRSWDEAQKYGFLSAGGGSRYTRPLQHLKPGDRVWVNAPGHGYVGVAQVTGFAQPAADFRIATPSGEMPVLDVVTKNYHRDKDQERCEYFVPVRWLQTVSLDKAVKEVGLFGVANIICRPTTPRWNSTVERLKQLFPDYDK